MRRMLTPLVAVAVAGCETSTSENSGPREFGKSSGVERVPVPKEAKRVEGLSQSDRVFIVPGYSYDELRDWYSTEMPDGIDWYQWQWCDIGGGPETGETLIYSKPGRRILAVSIVKDQPPGLIIGTDKSGPC